MAERNPLDALKARVSATWRKLTLLRLGQAFWPLYVWACLFVAIALVGIIERTHGAIAAGVSLFGIIGAVLLALRGWRAFVPVPRDEARELLDRQSDLRPISALTDRPARPDPATHALWVSHRQRLIAALKNLNPPSLRVPWRQLDPFRLRFVLPIAALCFALVAGERALPRLQQALTPDLGALMGADSMIVEAWITPPDHTGRAPIFLKPGLQNVRVPQGAEITLRTQARSAPRLLLKGTDTVRQTFAETPDGAYEAKAVLTEDTRVSVNWWGEREAWMILASDDMPPETSFVSIPLIGAQDRAEFSWEASDDYGVVRLALAIQPVTEEGEASHEEDRVPVPLPGESPKEAHDTVQMDLTRHKWAGMKVELTLVATDGAGQEGRSEARLFDLPEKLFLEPLARAAQEVRVTVLREPAEYGELPANPEAVRAGVMNTAPVNRLDAAPAGVKRAALMLDSLSIDGHRHIQDRSLFFAFRMAHGILKAADSKSEADEIDTLLWAAALKAEYGNAADALRRLMAARRALEQALRNGASEDEIKRRMEAFKDAANNYLAAKMAEAIANGTQEPQSTEDGEAMAGGPSMGGQDFDDMLQALQDLTETGATDQARQLLSDITNMLENLEFQKGQGKGQGMPGMPGENAENSEDDAPEEEQELTEAMKRLSDILREQRQLSDDTLAQERGERPGQQSGEQQGQQGQGQSGQSGQSQSDQGAEAGEAPGGGQAGAPDAAGDGGGEGEGDQPGTGSSERADGQEGAGRGSGGSDETLAERQARLGEMVEQFGRDKGFGEGADEDALAGRIDEDALSAIRQAQRRAADALEQGNERRAINNQELATRLLSDLSSDLASDLDGLRAARLGDQGQSGETDPLGRAINSGGANGQDVSIPDASERQRAKDILEELRRRYNDAEDETEREYLERLLDRF